MAKKEYVGVSGVARNTKKQYVGVSNGVAREVKKAYVGDSKGVARITFVSHEHTGKPGLTYANGCYTIPTEHEKVSYGEKLVNVYCSGTIQGPGASNMGYGGEVGPHGYTQYGIHVRWSCSGCSAGEDAYYWWDVGNMTQDEVRDACYEAVDSYNASLGIGSTCGRLKYSQYETDYDNPIYSTYETYDKLGCGYT